METTTNKRKTLESVRILSITLILMIISAFMCLMTVHGLEEGDPVFDLDVGWYEEGSVPIDFYGYI